MVSKRCGLAPTPYERTRVMTKSTNILLFAIVVMLFAIVFHFVSTGIDWLTFIIAIIGVAIGLIGLFWDDRQAQSARRDVPGDGQ
jgi:hypothetical protein